MTLRLSRLFQRWRHREAMITQPLASPVARAIEQHGYTFTCPHCGAVCGYTFENDYICDRHGFVNPIRSDGAVIRGDGVCGAMVEMPPT